MSAVARARWSCKIDIALFSARTSGLVSKSMGWVGGGAMATWSVWDVCVNAGRLSAKSDILAAIFTVSPVGICVGAKVGVIGLTGGRDGEDVDARRGFTTPFAPRAAPDAGSPSVVMVKPGIVATIALC